MSCGTFGQLSTLLTLGSPGQSIPGRRDNPVVREIIWTKLYTMQEAGVIHFCHSPYSPCSFFYKEGWGTHFCFDYCKLNDVTKADTYLVHQMKDSLGCVLHVVIFPTWTSCLGTSNSIWGRKTSWRQLLTVWKVYLIYMNAFQPEESRCDSEKGFQPTHDWANLGGSSKLSQWPYHFAPMFKIFLQLLEMVFQWFVMANLRPKPS